MKKIGVYIYKFCLKTVKNYIQNGCIERASALTIATLLAIVPLLAVFFGLFTFFPYFEQWLAPIQHLIFQNFMPDAGRSIETYLLNFIAKANHFSLVGAIGLVVYSLLLIYNIEMALNKIWRVKRARKPWNACIVYLLILILLPLLLGMGMLLSSYIHTNLLFGHDKFLKETMLVLHAPFFLGWVGFTCLYYIIPNCRVKLKHAAFGAFFATFFFEVAKKGFTVYLKYFASYEMLYGVFATIPIFIMWVYLVWLITLFCAEVSHTLTLRKINR